MSFTAGYPSGYPPVASGYPPRCVGLSPPAPLWKGGNK